MIDRRHIHVMWVKWDGLGSVSSNYLCPDCEYGHRKDTDCESKKHLCFENDVRCDHFRLEILSYHLNKSHVN